MVCLHNTKPIKYIPSNHLNMTVYWRFLCTGKAQASNQGNYKHASHVTSPPCKHRNKVHHKTRVGLTCCITWFRCLLQFSLPPAIVSFVPIQHYFKSTADIQTLYYLVGQSVSQSVTVLYTGLTFRSIHAGFPKYRCSWRTPRVVWIILGPGDPGLERRNLRVVKGLFWALPKLGRVHKKWNLLNNTIGITVSYATLYIYLYHTVIMISFLWA